MNTAITAIILAGGKSSRMGQNKALVKFKGLPLIQHAYNAIRPVSDEILISSNITLPGFSTSITIPDKFHNIGPIGGIYSCLEASQTELNLITTCDTPLLSTEFYKYLIEKAMDFDISNPVHQDINEPVIGVFRKRVLPVVFSFIEKKVYSPAKIIQSFKNQLIPIDPSLPFYHPLMFQSINTPEMLKRIESAA